MKKQIIENKKTEPSEDKKMVCVQIAYGREVVGIGNAGDEVMLDENSARTLIDKGLAIQVKKEK